ncbi:PqqD family protein [candidate division WOR-3 bacterium]|nr:PqqD family protein [candidate division WOR-3 bacterium]
MESERVQAAPGGGVDTDVRLDQVYMPSEDIVAREIEGELIIVPLVAGIGDMEDELYSLNDTGKDIWRRLDGRSTLDEVARVLADEYSAEPGEVEKDVVGLVGELVRRKMLVVRPRE